MLQRLRAQPGQKLLAGFETGRGGSFSKDSLYPQATARGDDPGRAANLASQPPAMQGVAMSESKAARQQAAGQAAAAGELDAAQQSGAQACKPSQAAADNSQAGNELPAGGASMAAELPSAVVAAAPSTGGDGRNAAPPLPSRQPDDHLELSLQLPPDPEEGVAAAPAATAASSPCLLEQPAAPHNCTPAVQQPQQEQVQELPPSHRPVANDMVLAQQVRQVKH